MRNHGLNWGTELKTLGLPLPFQIWLDCLGFDHGVDLNLTADHRGTCMGGGQGDRGFKWQPSMGQELQRFIASPGIAVNVTIGVEVGWYPLTQKTCSPGS